MTPTTKTPEKVIRVAGTPQPKSNSPIKRPYTSDRVAGGGGAAARGIKKLEIDN